MLQTKTDGRGYPPEDFDQQLLRHGAVALFYREAVLAEAIQWLQTRHYLVPVLDCGAWQTTADFHRVVAQALAFPDYYGRNLDALRDCLRDVDIPATSGMAIVLLHYDAFAGRVPDVAHALADILAGASWDFLVAGRKLLTLVQSDDPGIQLAALGCRHAIWNGREWLNKNRGLG